MTDKDHEETGRVEIGHRCIAKHQFVHASMTKQRQITQRDLITEILMSVCSLQIYIKGTESWVTRDVIYHERVREFFWVISFTLLLFLILKSRTSNIYSWSEMTSVLFCFYRSTKPRTHIQLISDTFLSIQIWQSNQTFWSVDVG